MPVILCLAGLLNFRQERNPLKLWVPPDSDFLVDTEWIMSSFKEGQRTEVMIFGADNVLEPQALVQLNEIIKNVTFDDGYNLWPQVCFKLV